MLISLKLALFALAVLAIAFAIFIAATWAPEKSLEELKARWARPPSRFIDVGGMHVHLRDEGPRDDPAPIVLVHGTGSSLYAWEGWANALKDKRRVIRYDMAGFGLTGPSPDGVYNVGRDAQMLIGILDALGILRAVVGGNSLGGTVAWRTALAYPDRVEKLILVNSGGYGTIAQSSPIGMTLLEIPGVRWLMQCTLPRFLVAQGYRNIFGDPTKVTEEMIERSVELTQREGNRRALVERVMQRAPSGQSAHIPELKVPTLIIWGGKDRLIPIHDAHRFHREIKGSTLVIFDDLGHAPEEEDPERSVAAVKEFLGIT